MESRIEFGKAGGGDRRQEMLDVILGNCHALSTLQVCRCMPIRRSKSGDDDKA